MQDSLNPAVRLHVLLTSAMQGEPSEAMLHVWAKLFDIEEPTEIKVARYLISMSECLDETKRLLATRQGLDLALYTQEFHMVERAIAPTMLVQPRSQVLHQYLQPTVLMRLQFCAEEIRRFYSESRIADEDLEAIRTTAEALFAQVYESTLDSDLRIALLEDLEKIRAAIAMYKLRGAKGLRDAQRSLVGAIAAQADVTTSATSSDQSLLTKIGNLVKQIDEITAKAISTYKRLNGPVRSVLGFFGVDLPALPGPGPDSRGTEEA